LAPWPIARRLRLRDQANIDGRAHAAITRIKAYAAPRRKRLLVVEDDKAQQVSIEALLGYDDINVTFADTGAEALAAVTNEAFDCLVSICGCQT